MAISRMQEPQQIQSGIGSLQDPRQGYFLGKLVKKAGRAVKKVFKSPLGKMALLGGGIYGLNKSNTAWVRKGVEGSDDKFIKALTEAEKIELVALVKEHNTLGE